MHSACQETYGINIFCSGNNHKYLSFHLHQSNQHTLRTLLLQKAKCSSKSYESRNIIKLRAVNQSKANLKTIVVILGRDKTSREGGIRSTDGSGTFYRISRYFHCQR